MQACVVNDREKLDEILRIRKERYVRIVNERNKYNELNKEESNFNLYRFQ